MSMGVILENGPQHWAIIQRDNQGKGSIHLSGRWCTDGETQFKSTRVWVRVVEEHTGADVVPWVPCRMENDMGWSIHVRDIPQGGLYRVETALQLDDHPELQWAMRGDMIHHLGIGDLWVIAGQSNAAGFGRGPVYDPPVPGVHVLRFNGSWDLAVHPLHDSTDTRLPESRDYANTAHSPYLVFAKTVKERTGVPIGLIPVAKGGTALKYWHPEEDGVLYRNMMKAIKAAGGRVTGLLWYQGESDALHPLPGYCDENPLNTPSYFDRFASLVGACRRDLQHTDLPVLTVQLNRMTLQTSEEAAHRSWSLVRDMQRKAARSIPGVYIVPSLDSPLSDWIHNSAAANMTLGLRLAACALSEVYGMDTAWRAPEIVEAVFAEGGSEIHIHFASVCGRLSHTGNPVVFHVEDEKGMEPVTGWDVVDRGQIRLTPNRAMSAKTKVHAGYSLNPTPFLPIDSVTGLPILAFCDVPVRPASEHEP